VRLYADFVCVYSSLLLIASSVHRQSSVGYLIVDDVALDLLAVAEDVTVLLDLTGAFAVLLQCAEFEVEDFVYPFL